MDKEVKRDRALLEYLTHKYGKEKVLLAMKQVKENLQKNNTRANNGK